MERIPEPELMDDEAQARAYAEADFAKPHEWFVARLRELLPDLPAGGCALDLGCGPADVTLRFARAFPSWTVDGIDGSAAMLRHGRAAVARAGVGRRVSLARARLPGDPPPRPRYDLVLSNSLLHHLVRPAVLWASVRRWGAGGGAVFVMDLRRPRSLAEARGLVRQHAGDEPEVLRRDFLHSLLAAYRVGEVREQLREAGLGGLRVARATDRHLLAWGRLPGPDPA